MTEILNAALTKNALGRFKVESTLSQSLEDAFEVFQMSMEIATIYEDVVEEDEYELADERPK